MTMVETSMEGIAHYYSTDACRRSENREPLHYHDGHLRPTTACDVVRSPASPRTPTSLPMPRPTTAPNACDHSTMALAAPHNAMNTDDATLSLEDRFPFLRDDRKRTRKLLSQDQTRLLEAILERTVYPSTPLREAIARYLGVSPRKVQIWFQNKRQISRRHTNQTSIRGCGGMNDGAAALPITRSRRATEGSDGYHASERLMRYRSAEDDLRLAGLLDREGHQFPELQMWASHSPNLSPQRACFDRGIDARYSEYQYGKPMAGIKPMESVAYQPDIPRSRTRSYQSPELNSRAYRSDPQPRFSAGSSAFGQGHQRHATHDIASTSRGPTYDDASRILPLPRRQSYLGNSKARLVGRSLASLSDIALCRPEQVPALCTSTTPEALSPTSPSNFRTQFRSRAATNESSDTGLESLASRTSSLRCGSPSISSRSSTPSPMTPSTLHLVNRSEDERNKTLPSLAALNFK